MKAGDRVMYLHGHQQTQAAGNGDPLDVYGRSDNRARLSTLSLSLSFFLSLSLSQEYKDNFSHESQIVGGSIRIEVNNASAWFNGQFPRISLPSSIVHTESHFLINFQR